MEVFLGKGRVVTQNKLKKLNKCSSVDKTLRELFPKDFDILIEAAETIKECCLNIRLEKKTLGDKPKVIN